MFPRYGGFGIESRLLYVVCVLHDSSAFMLVLVLLMLVWGRVDGVGVRGFGCC